MKGQGYYSRHASGSPWARAVNKARQLVPTGFGVRDTETGRWLTRTEMRRRAPKTGDCRMEFDSAYEALVNARVCDYAEPRYVVTAFYD